MTSSPRSSPEARLGLAPLAYNSRVSRARGRLLGVAVVGFLASARPAFAIAGRTWLEHMIANSDLIVLGDVESIESAEQTPNRKREGRPNVQGQARYVAEVRGFPRMELRQQLG